MNEIMKSKAFQALLDESRKTTTAFSAEQVKAITAAMEQYALGLQGEGCRETLLDILNYKPGMAEYFMQHNYREMYKLWEAILSKVEQQLLDTIPAHPLTPTTQTK